VAAWSSDGSTWTQQSDLLSKDATVSAVSQSGGLIVAVGWTGDVTNATAMAWSTSDLRTWHATKLPAPADTTAYGIAVGPAGFLAWGFGETSTELWLSTDGIAWRALATTGLWAMGIDELYAVPGGYAIRGSLSDRSAVWQSSDGATWTQAWTGPGPSGMEGYSLGPISKAPAGGYVSFGTAYMAPGGPATVPYDLLVWTSSDMIHWTLAKRIARPGWMDGFAAIPGGYVAAGAQPAAGDAGVVSWGSLAVWTSSDGLSWQRLADISVDGPIEVLSVVSDGKHAIVSILNKAGSTALLVGNGLQ
jgi:hypothetical protein